MFGLGVGSTSGHRTSEIESFGFHNCSDDLSWEDLPRQLTLGAITLAIAILCSRFEYRQKSDQRLFLLYY
jgi:hypothetical protein